MDNYVFEVSQLTNHIKDLLDSDPSLASLYVRGELSNYKVYPSGHHYFTMKDAEGALKCVMFKSNAIRVRFRPENGMKVIACGRVSVYPRDGVYQLYVTSMTPDGVGDLHVAFEQLKEKLFKEGLFDPAHKKPIPRFPKTIAVITSSAGAAVRDIIRILGQRWPMAKVLLLPVRVQGEEAPAEIAGALRYANKYKIAQLIITGRGGGSIEDLWAFNDERVARAIYDSEIPVISAVGHEPDITIADFVADKRASTPSNGAELAVPDVRDVLGGLESYDIRMTQGLKKELDMLRRRLDTLASKRALTTPSAYIDDKRILLDRTQERLIAAYERALGVQREKYVKLAAALDAMSPLKVLGRGYAIAKSEDGKVIKSSKDVKPGDTISVRLKKDEINCIVKE